MPIELDMSIEETIEHLERIAKNQFECADRIDELHCDSTSTRNMASYHKRLADWLKELKKYREILTRLDAMIDCYENCESCQGFREYPTSQFVKDVIQINKEINADDNN